MRLNRSQLVGGEGDECTCPQCRAEAPEWMPALEEREEQRQDAWPV